VQRRETNFSTRQKHPPKRRRVFSQIVGGLAPETLNAKLNSPINDFERRYPEELASVISNQRDIQ